MFCQNRFFVILCFLLQFICRMSASIVREILIRCNPIYRVYCKLQCKDAPNIKVNKLKIPQVTQDYREFFEAVLIDSFFASQLQKGRSSSELKSDIADHVENRYLNFRDNLIPWLQKCQPDMSYMNVIEVGSGTGSSTLAIAPYVNTVTCFEIDEVANIAARERLKYFDINNCTIKSEMFSPQSEQSEFMQSNKIHGVFLCAVLEHMTFCELRPLLKTAWNCLVSGGILVVADTPNRFIFYRSPH